MNIFSKLLKSLEMSKSTSTDISSEPVAPAGGISIYFSNGQLYKIIPEDTQDYYDAMLSFICYLRFILLLLTTPEP